MTLILLSCAWVLGVFCGLLQAWIAAVFPIGLILVLLLRRARWARHTLVAGVMLSLLAVGALRAYAHVSARAQDSLGPMAGGVVLEGGIAQPPEPREASVRWLLQVQRMRALPDGEWREATAPVLVYTRVGAPLVYGDTVRVAGKLEAPPTFEGFDYQQYLARQGIHWLMRYPRLEVTGHNQGNPLLAGVYGVRQRLVESLEAALPEPQSALAQGILLGVRSSIPADVNDAFARTGTTHVLAISGSNLSVVVGLLTAVPWFGGRHRRGYLALVLVGLWAYTLLAGMSPSLVRAAIMATLVLGAQAAGRQAFAPGLLALTAAAMTAVDPGLLTDLGFQLSFLSLGGILLIDPIIRKFAARSPIPTANLHSWLAVALRGAGVAGSATVAASLATLPVQVLNFQNAPVVGLPATIFALPALPFILIGAGLTAVAGVLTAALAFPFAAVTWAFSSYLLWVVQAWAALPAASVHTPALPAGLAWAYYSVLGALLWLAARYAAGSRIQTPASPPPRPSLSLRWATTGATVTAFGLGALVWSRVLITSPDVVVRFLDVGQGDSILLESPSGQRVLVDGGPSGGRLMAELGSVLPFWDRSIALIVLTHPQRDHMTGLFDVVRRYPVGGVLEGPAWGEGPEYAEWERLLTERHIPRFRAQPGMRWGLEQLTLSVLGPQPNGSPARSVNDASVVLRAEAYGHSLLLTGDIERPGEVELLRYRDGLNSTLLKLAHHGSDTSSTPVFLDLVSPQAGVISVGAKNPFRHPSAATLERFGSLPLLRTDLDGIVEARFSPEGLRVRGERPRIE